MGTPSKEIDNMIERLTDWRGPAITHLREVINQSGSNLAEGWKWGTPVWTGKRNVLVLGAFREHVKITFSKGSSLADPQGLFNAGLDSKEWRSIDFRDGDEIDEAALQSLVRAAAELDSAKR